MYGAYKEPIQVEAEILILHHENSILKPCTNLLSPKSFELST